MTAELGQRDTCSRCGGALRGYAKVKNRDTGARYHLLHEDCITYLGQRVAALESTKENRRV